MFIRTALLITYFATIVTSNYLKSSDNLKRPASSGFRILGLHENREVSQLGSDEYYLLNNRHNIEFDINGDKIELNLTLSTRDVVSYDILISVVKFKFGQTPNYTYERVKNIKEMLNGKFYVDNEKKAVLLARYNYSRNKLTYDGVIGEGNTRRLVYSITSQSIERTKRAHEENENQIIIDSPENYDDHNEPIIIERNGIQLTRLNKPLEILYPKMLIVVDYHLFSYLNFDVAETIRYVTTFWNVVDQKYANIKSPKVQIVVTGIIIISDEEALNFTYYYKSHTSESDINELLSNARVYFSRKFVDDTGFKNYDATIIMTGLKLKRYAGFLDVLGLTAKLGGICTRDNNIAVTTDKAEYNTLIAIHELGHLLNLSHDYADECDGISYLFDSLKTSVMSTPSDGTDIFWSECSLRLLKEFSTLKAAECLRSRQRTM